MRMNGLIGLFCLLAWSTALAAPERHRLRVAYNENFFPFSYTEESKLQGLEIDLMNELAKRMDLEVKHLGFPWERAQNMVAEGKVDAFVTVATDNRRKYAAMSKNPLIKTNIVAAACRENPRLQTLLKIKDLKEVLQFTHVNTAGSGWAKAYLGTARVTYVGSPDAIFKFLLANRADLYVETENNIRLNLKRLKLEDKFVVLPAVLASVELRLGISQRSPLAPRMKSFDDAIKKMQDDGTIHRFFTKWTYETDAPAKE